MTRPYRLGKRAVQAAAARQRIIDAARDLIAEAGVRGASLDAVARRATSTRTTVYDQFGSREELLLAVLHDALDRANVRAVRKALQDDDAAEDAPHDPSAPDRPAGVPSARLLRARRAR